MDGKQTLRQRSIEAESVVRCAVVAGLFGIALGLVVAYGLASATGLLDRGGLP